MTKQKRFDYSEKKIDFGFEYFPKKTGKITLDKIIKSVDKNIVIYDFNNIILSRITFLGTDLLNDKNRLFIALTSEKELNKIKSNGVKSGFFRSIRQESHGAVIIVDKSEMYYAVNDNIVFECNKAEIKEMFNYINYLIWNRSTYEILEGNMSEVKEIRHSVVKPVFEKLLNKEAIMQKDIISATKDFQLEEVEKLIYEESNIENSIIIDSEISSMAKTNDATYINTIENLYTQVKYDDSIELAKSFNNVLLKDLNGKTIWVNGKKFLVEENLQINQKADLPLDELNDYDPDFSKFIPNQQVDKYLYIDVILDISSIQIDQSFKISKRYKEREKLFKRIDTETDKLIKLFDEEEKVLLSIKEESRLLEKAKIFNDFIDKHEVGLKPLKTNKGKPAIKKIIFNENDLIVPNELLGELYEKGNGLYLALDKDSKIIEAKRFLKDNNIKADLVLK